MTDRWTEAIAISLFLKKRGDNEMCAICTGFIVFAFPVIVTVTIPLYNCCAFVWCSIHVCCINKGTTILCLIF